MTIETDMKVIKDAVEKMTRAPANANPHCDVAADPRPSIDDSYRERKNMKQQRCEYESEIGSCDLNGEACCHNEDCAMYEVRTHKDDILEEVLDKIKSLAFDSEKRIFHLCLNTFVVIDAINSLRTEAEKKEERR